MGVRVVNARSRAVFLDRDGVLNEARVIAGKPHPPNSLSQLRVVQDAAVALARLKRAGLKLICVTNQPDVARGRKRREEVEAINTALSAVLPLDETAVCYHDDEDRCDCRKPMPGLLLRAAFAHAIDLRRSFMIGDRWKDVEAGHRAGCRTVLIECGYEEKFEGRAPHFTAQSLTDAVNWILDQPDETEKER